MVELPANDDEFTMEVREASPAHLLMKIESFSLLSKHEIEKYESTEFEAGDYKWDVIQRTLLGKQAKQAFGLKLNAYLLYLDRRLIIHPNGLSKNENNEDHHISVYLAIVETSSMPVGWEVNAIFSIFLYNQLLDNYLSFQGKLRRFHAMKSQWGFSKLMSKESLRAPANGFLVDDKCVFGAEVAVIKTQCVTQCVSVREFGKRYMREWKISNFSKLQEDWKSEEFTAGDHKWNIQLFPNGNQGEEGLSVSIYLNLVGAKSFGANERVKADYYVRIKNQLKDQPHSQHISHWFTSAYGYGWPDFIPLSDMRDPNKGFVVEDCCIIQVEISVGAVVS